MRDVHKNLTFEPGTGHRVQAALVELRDKPVNEGRPLDRLKSAVT